MGKIRVKTFEEGEGAQEVSGQDKYKERLAKKAARQQQVDVDGTPQEPVMNVDGEEIVEKAAKTRVKQESGKRQKENESLINKNTYYPLEKAIEMLKKFKKAKFDETVELHINTKDKGVSGQVVLPHGTGKKLNVKIADDALVSQIETGKIDFDILIATPDMMPKLAKVAKVLGPRGLMPNPKNGTITPKPEEAIEKLTKGQITYKTEAKTPVMHVVVGKSSFEDKALKDNITTLISAVGTGKINEITLTSTMTPGVKVDVSKLA